MALVWKPSVFNDLKEAKQYIYDNPEIVNLNTDKQVMNLLETNNQVFDAFLGKTEPLAVSFYFLDDNDTIIDGSEIFLIVNKFEVTFIEGLWNYHIPFSLTLAKSVFFETFHQLEKA